jgi:RNA polymerase subunit RPABC4/transcription elongation factor Spt4
LITITVAVGALTTSCGSSDEIVSPPERWVLTMADEFDSGAAPSPALWTIETGYGPDDDGWGNDEWQLYTDSRENVRVEGGNLVISAQSECLRVELATNGGFETGNLDGWTLSCESNNVTCAATMDEARTGDWSGNVVVADPSTSALIKQEGIGVGIVLPNTEVTVQFALLGSDIERGKVVAEFLSEVDGGDPSKTEILGGGPLVPTDQWVRHSYTVTTGDDVSGGVTLQLKTECGAVENGAGGNGGGAGGAGGAGVTIKPACGKRDDSITSARIKTKVYDCDGGMGGVGGTGGVGDDRKCGFEQKNGRFEARIKLPEGQGLWPAFWMLGANIDEVPWPGCGEIDVMEDFGREPGVVSGALHGPGYSGEESISRIFSLPDATFDATTEQAKTGDWSGNVVAPGPSTSPVIQQANMGAGVVAPNSEVAISFALRGESTGESGAVFAELFSEVSGGGTSKSEIIRVGPLVPTDQWVPYSYTVTTGDDVSGGLTLELKAACDAVASCAVNAYFDDVTITTGAVELVANGGFETGNTDGWTFFDNSGTFADAFHVFAVEWDPGRITFSVDSQVYRIVTSSEVSARGDWVFDHDFFVLLNLAVGGNPVPEPDLSGAIFPAEMLVDYVRIFERPQ